MGSSTGDMLVDDKKVLEEIFEKSPMLIAVHCEDEDTIKHNTQLAIENMERTFLFLNTQIFVQLFTFINLLQ